MKRQGPLEKYFSAYRDPGETVLLALNDGPASKIFLSLLFISPIGIFALSWYIGSLLHASSLAKLFVSGCWVFVGTIPIAYVLWLVVRSLTEAYANIVYRIRLMVD